MRFVPLPTMSDKSDKTQAQKEKEAERRLADAHAELVKAQEAAAEANEGLVAAKMSNVPRVKVKVLPGNVVSDTENGKLCEEGDELNLDGPDAIALMQLGHVVIQGEA